MSDVGCVIEWLVTAVGLSNSIVGSISVWDTWVGSVLVTMVG